MENAWGNKIFPLQVIWAAITIEFMEDKTNVIVFEKKEIFLIFFFLIAICATSLAIGYRFGYQEASEKVAEIEQQLKQVSVEQAESGLKSKSEEEAEEVVKEVDINKEINMEDKSDEDLQKLKEEFAKLEKDDPLDKKARENDQKMQDSSQAQSADEVQQESSRSVISSPSDSRKGKYTIQLGAYNDLDDAKLFASAFTEQGYNPVINQVNLNDGTWYRVSIGIFDSAEEAKKYMEEESDFFAGRREHFITTIK